MKSLNLLLLIFLLSACPDGNRRPGYIYKKRFDGMTAVYETAANKPFCKKTGGTWTKYHDSCADFCFIEREKLDGKTPVCSLESVHSCDCGPGKCWNSYTCEDIEKPKEAAKK